MSAGVGPSQSSGAPPVDLLTSSRMKTWRSCPRRHYYQYELARASHGPESAASALGTTVHAALEAWWCTWRDLGGYGALDAALYAARGDEDAEADRERDPYTVALTQALVIAYDARWSRWAASVEVLGVEAPFVAPLEHPTLGLRARRWAVAGKMDVLLRLSDGRVAIVDHKVTASDARVGSDWRRKLTLDPQVSTYFGGAEALGHPADLALWDVIQRPALKPYKAVAEVKLKLDGTPRAGQRLADETPDEYQERLIARHGREDFTIKRASACRGCFARNGSRRGWRMASHRCALGWHPVQSDKSECWRYNHPQQSRCWSPRTLSKRDCCSMA